MTTPRLHSRLWPRGTSRSQRIERESQVHEGRPSLPPIAGLLDDRALIAVIYAPAPKMASWIEAELAHDTSLVQTARTMQRLLEALLEDPTPRPNILIVDFDALSPVEVMELHSIRHRGWFGSIIALGRVPTALKNSLSIDIALTPPFVQHQLHDALIELRTPAPTRRIPVIRDDLR